MTALERLKALLNIITWRNAEKWLLASYLFCQLVMLAISPTFSIAMGIFLISVVLAANSF